MTPPGRREYTPAQAAAADDASIPNVVVVDPRFDAYKPLAASARLGKLTIHFRGSGSDAIKLSRRRRVDAWLIAPELEDMSGHDFVELLQESLGNSRIAMIETAGPGSRRWDVATQEAAEAGADATLSAPITFRDLESLLGLSSEERTVVLAENKTASRAFVTLPVGVGAAVVAIAVLMLS
jgi:CheY-like chemotaxis protein